MGGILRFARTTALGGLVFLLPLIVVLALLAEAFRIVLDVAEPLSRLVPLERIGGVAVASLLAVLLLVLLCFLVGLLARTTIARRLRGRLEAKVLAGVPFYAFVKSMFSSAAPADGEEGLKPVLVRFDDYGQIAFEVERLAGGEVVVFLPSAPNPWTGVVQLVAAERVTALPATVLGSVRSIQQLGIGSGDLLAGKAADRDAPAETPPQQRPPEAAPTAS